MALKGQKYSKYSDELKSEIMTKINSGMSIRYVAKQYEIPSGTVMTWTMKKNHPELNLTKEDWKERYEILKKYQAFLKAQREKK